MTPFKAIWDGTAFRPLQRYHNILRAQISVGDIVPLERHEERSVATHNHEFAWLKDAWQNLPESIAADYPSAEHLRKRALINTGWCDVRDYACNSRAEAMRLAAALRGELDDYTVVVVQDAAVRVLRAKSQGRGKMSPANFQASKQAILDWVAELIGVAPAELQHASAA